MTDTTSTRRQPAIQAVLALMCVLTAAAAAVAVADAVVLTHLSAANADQVVRLIRLAHVPGGHTDVVGQTVSMRHTVIVSLVFAVLAVAFAMLTVRVTMLAMHRGRIVIWVGALVLGAAQLIWIAAEPSTVFDGAEHVLAPAELRQPGAAEAYAQLLPGWYPVCYYLFELAVVAVLAAASILLLRPGVATYYLSTRHLSDPL